MSKPTKYTTLRANPKVNYGLWVIMVSQRRFLDAKNVPLWCYILIVRDVGGRGIQEISLFLFDFAVNPKLH